MLNLFAPESTYNTFTCLHVFLGNIFMKHIYLKRVLWFAYSIILEQHFNNVSNLLIELLSVIKLWSLRFRFTRKPWGSVSSTLHVWCCSRHYMYGVILDTICMVLFSTLHAWCCSRHYMYGVVLDTTCMVLFSVGFILHTGVLSCRERVEYNVQHS